MCPTWQRQGAPSPGNESSALNSKGTPTHKARKRKGIDRAPLSGGRPPNRLRARLALRAEESDKSGLARASAGGNG